MSGSSNETKRSRTLVLCFDGTSNEFDTNNTNVVKLYSLMQRNNPDEQLCYYQAGIGTYFKPGVISPLFSWLATIADEAIAWYLSEHVMEGYTFLMQNYRFGDKICIFGFSRGAYTARALAGMLFKVGLLPKDNPEQVPFAYKLYKRTDAEGQQLSAGFKQTFAQNVEVEFMGLWDTVASIGVIMSKTLPFTNSNSSIKTFRHALSLDEHRAKFQPNLFHRPSPNPTHDPEDASPVMSRAATSANPAAKPIPIPDSPKGLGFMRRLSSRRRYVISNGKEKETDKTPLNGNGIHPNVTPFEVPTPTKNDPDKDTDVLEVWFPGCHSDVGGGAVEDTTRLSLGQITLRWMVKEIIKSQCGIIFDQMALKRNNINIYTSNFPKEKESVEITPLVDNADPGDFDDSIDAVQPLHDELKQKPIWWLLEIIPTHYAFQDGEGVWHSNWGFHMGKGRVIPDCGPVFHSSVKDREDDSTLKYTPKAQWAPGTETYVD